MILTDLSKAIHAANVEKGFYEEGEDRNIPEMLALIHSEVSEALEAHRKDKFFETDGSYSIADVLEIQQDAAFKNAFLNSAKDTFEDEIADSIIRLLDLAAYRGIDISSHVSAKMRYNQMRPHKHGKKY